MLQARHILVLMGALSLAMPAVAGAQTFAAGVKAGIAVTGLPHAGEVVDQIVLQTSAESSSKVGVAFGGYVRFPINERLGFQPEAMFVMKGVKLDEPATGGSVNVRLNYLDVPLLIRYETPAQDGRRLYAMAGPSFGIKLSDSAQFDGTGKTQDVDLEPALKTLDLGLAFGGGVAYEKYFIEGRFVAGVTDVASTTFVHPDSLRNRTFLIMAGFSLR